VREFGADCSLCMLDADIPYIMELELSNLDCAKDAPRVAAIDSVSFAETNIGLVRQNACSYL